MHAESLVLPELDLFGHKPVATPVGRARNIVPAIILLLQRRDALIEDGARLDNLLVDQGRADNFLDEQLKTWLLEDAVREAGMDATIRMQEGYDHSYFFVSTFIADHIKWHAERLKA